MRFVNFKTLATTASIAMLTMACSRGTSYQLRDITSGTTTVTEAAPSNAAAGTTGGFSLGSGSDVPYETVWGDVTLTVTENFAFGTFESPDGDTFTYDEATATANAKANRDKVWTVVRDTMQLTCNARAKGQGVLRFRNAKTNTTSVNSLTEDVDYVSATSSQTIACEEVKDAIYPHATYCAAITGNPVSTHVALSVPGISSYQVRLGTFDEFSIAHKNITVFSQAGYEAEQAAIIPSLQNACTAAGGDAFGVLRQTNFWGGWNLAVDPATSLNKWYDIAGVVLTYVCCSDANGA